MAQRAATQTNLSTVVIDNGTGYTKMGYAGNLEPSYLIPSCIAKSVQKVSNDGPAALFISRALAIANWGVEVNGIFLCECSKVVLARRTCSTIRSSTSTSATRPSPEEKLTRSTGC